MATEETPTQTPAPEASPAVPEATAATVAEATAAPVKPTLSDAQKFQIRDAQLKQQTAQIQFQNAANAARTAEQGFRGLISQLANELTVDVSLWQLNLDVLEFEPRAAAAQPPAAK